MCWLTTLVPFFVSTIIAVTLVSTWSSSVSYENGFICTSCVTAGYVVNADPTPCFQKCCVFDANSGCLVACNCWLGVVIVNITSAAVVDALLQTGTFSSVSQAAMVNTLQSTYPLGQNFTCYFPQSNPNDVRLSLNLGDTQGVFIAAMVFFAVAGCLAIATVILCIRGDKGPKWTSGGEENVRSILRLKIFTKHTTKNVHSRF